MSVVRTSGPLIYRKGFKYVLAETFAVQTPIRSMPCFIPAKDGGRPWVELRNDGIIILREGYASDGPSGLTIDSPCAMPAAYTHDGFYQLGRAGNLPGEKHDGGETRERIDNFFLEHLIHDGMEPLRAHVWHGVVRLCAGYAYELQPEKLHYAPSRDVPATLLIPLPVPIVV